MWKNNFEIAREIVEQYNQAYLQWDTFLHIQEWIDEKISKENKKSWKTQKLISDLQKIIPDINKTKDKETILKSCERLAFLQNKLNNLNSKK